MHLSGKTSQNSGFLLCNVSTTFLCIFAISNTHLAGYDLHQQCFDLISGLGACIPLLPWVPAMILKSGWIPSLLTMLWDTKGQFINKKKNSCYSTVKLALNSHWFGRPLVASDHFSIFFLLSLIYLRPTLWNAVNGHGNSGN